MSNQTLLNCPSCFKEPISIINILLSSSDRYQLSYYCNRQSSRKVIEIDQYLSSIIKSRYCNIHPNSPSVYYLGKDKYLCQNCYKSLITSNRFDTQDSSKTNKTCPRHSSKRIKSHCDKCNVDVCRLCITESHSDHCNWMLLTKSDMNVKASFKKGFHFLASHIDESIKRIDESINTLEKTRKRIIQGYNNYLNVNLPILNLYELMFRDNQIKPSNDLISTIKAFSFNLTNQTTKLFAKLKGEAVIISNSIEVIKKGMDYVFALSPFHFKVAKVSESISKWRVSSNSTQHLNLTSCNVKPFNQVSVTLKDHIGTIYSLIQLTNGNFASSSADGTIKFWDSYSFKLLYSILAHTESVNVITEIKEDLIASCSNDNTIKFWYLSNDAFQVTTIKEKAPIISIESLSNELIVSFSGSQLNVWNISKQLLSFSRKLPNANSMKRILKNTFASSMEDYSIMVYDLFDSSQSFFLMGHSEIVSSIIPFRNGYIVSGSFDRSIRVWNLSTQQCDYMFNEAHLYAINCLVELRDGRIASGSNDKVISIWDLDTKQCNVTLVGHEGAVRSLIQLSNGKIVSGSSDETIKVWE